MLPWEMHEYFPVFAEEMKQRLETPLAQQFPTLPFAGSADKWLASIKRKSIEKQLAERKIPRIGITVGGYGFISLPEPYEVFSILINVDLPYGERLLTLGHEIGHTFHFDLTDTPIKNLLPDDWNHEVGEDERGNSVMGPLYHMVEDFAETFAEKWLSVNGKQKIDAWRQHRNAKVNS